MTTPVIRGVAYCLIHAPSLVRYGTTCDLEHAKGEAAAPWLQQVPGRTRSYGEVVSYPPNQVFVGGRTPWDLAEIPRPWLDHPVPGANRFGAYGEIMPEDEFYGAMALADSFQLVSLTEEFTAAIKPKLAAHPCYGEAEANRLGAGQPTGSVQQAVDKGALPLYHADALVGCVRPAHEVDATLGSHVILENLASKASAALALKHLLRSSGVGAGSVDYLLECSEEACGDMNQRGGGGFAKAIGELAGCTAATGSDVRAFCAAPSHALVQGGALVQAGVYGQVVVMAGGSTAKLGMNCREHIARDLPVLEDVMGSFAILLGPDDGRNPVLRIDQIGRHTIGAGAAPQAVMQAVVIDPLEKAGLKVSDVDVYAAELQNPEVTEPAGAGDVPRANLRMIGALAVKRGELERTDLDRFVAKHGIPGFAPTQGHIPSGVPFVGHARDALLAGKIRRAMIIGKGSLFLGRMTNLFDGISLLLEPNPAVVKTDSASGIRRLRIGVTTMGSELGVAEVVRGAEAAQREQPEIEVVLLGDGAGSSLTTVPAPDAATAHSAMERMLAAGDLDAAVTMHYNFPLGVASVGRVVTPARGRELLLATTTGAPSTDRVEGLVRGAVYGLAVARALGMSAPKVGLLNIDGAAVAERILRRMAAGGYPITLAESARPGGGALMRGNDVLAPEADILVTDSLTGNVLCKMLSAFTTAGSYESIGFGYGPGVGPEFPYVVNIVSRASGAPVLKNAIVYAAAAAKAQLPRLVREEWQRACRSGMEEFVRPAGQATTPTAPSGAPAPAPKPVSHEIPGIDVLELDDAVSVLARSGIYAQAGMGCTGPVLLVAPDEAAQAREVLRGAGVMS